MDVRNAAVVRATAHMDLFLSSFYQKGAEFGHRRSTVEISTTQRQAGEEITCYGPAYKNGLAIYGSQSGR